MMLQKKPLLLLGMTAFLCGCSESYPTIEDIVMPEQREVSSSLNSETESDLVPIRPTVDAPDFHITTRGTGSGPFDTWEEDEDHWRQAQFHVFAYQTNNKYGGAVDMSLKNDDQIGKAGVTSESRCLLYDRIMMAKGYNNMQFVDPNHVENEKVYYYRVNHQNFKYNFFTYYVDDAANGKVLDHSEPSKVKLDFQIDGSQDLMHSFAYHTKAEFQNFIDEWSKTSNKDQLKVLTDANSYENLLYSSATGHRSINPRFNIRHLLSKFNILVRGATTPGGDITSDFRNILITGIKIESPYKGTLIVADDAWGQYSDVADAAGDQGLGYKYEKVYASGELIRWKTDKAWLTTPLNPHSNLATTSPKIDAKIRTYPELQPYIDSYFHVTSTEPEKLTKKPFLLAPVKNNGGDARYNLHIDGFLLNRVMGATESLDDLDSDEPYFSFNIDAPVQLQDGKDFEPGKEYTLTIYVYGYQKIGLKVAFGNPWIHGEDIDINKDGEGEGK